VNQEMVPRRRWGERDLAEGDSIEIVTPRQGG
jgi:thiamine biosynthesis protein ThiS